MMIKSDRPIAPGVSFSVLCILAASCLGQHRAQQSGAVPRQDGYFGKGVVFVAKWEFEEPVVFHGSHPAPARRGYMVGLVAEPGYFPISSLPMSLVYAGEIEGVYRGMSSYLPGLSKIPFVILQFPELDLTTSRFWIGPRTLPGKRSPEKIASDYERAKAEKRLVGPLSKEAIREASRVLTDSTISSIEEFQSALRLFGEQVKNGTVKLRIIPFENVPNAHEERDEVDDEDDAS